jgi:hypothetical protein
MEEEQELNINPDDLQDVICDNCGSGLFKQRHILKKLTADVAELERPTFAPMIIFQCADCNHINEELIPAGKHSLSGLKIENEKKKLSKTVSPFG